MMGVELLPGMLCSNPLELRQIATRIFHNLDPDDSFFDDRNVRYALFRDYDGDSVTTTLRLEVYKCVIEHATNRALQSTQDKDVPTDTAGTAGSEQETEATSEHEGDEHGDGEDGAPNASKKYHWSPTDPLCGVCFETLLRNWFYAWWLDERESSRVKSAYLGSIVAISGMH